MGTALGNSAGGTGGFALQSSLGSFLPLAGGTMSGDIAMSTHNVTGAGTVSATTLTGTLSTAAQPNVTSVGTLAGLTVTGSFTATGLVTNADLANSTISGVALGGTLGTLTFGTHLAAGSASYNGSAGVTISTDATNANTASTIVARDASGNFTAGTITASLTGGASLDLPLAGGTLTGKLTTLASAVGGAGLNLPAGAAPTSPVNGDLWTTTAGLFARINGITVGPYAVSGVTSISDNGGGTLSFSASTGVVTAGCATATTAQIGCAKFGTGLTVTAGNVVPTFGTAANQVVQGGVITAGGPTGSATVAPIVTYNAAGQLTAVSSATITPAVGSVTGLGSGVATALGNTAGGSGGFALQSSLASYLPLAGGTMTGTLTAADGGAWSSSGLGVGGALSSTFNFTDNGSGAVILASGNPGNIVGHYNGGNVPAVWGVQYVYTSTPQTRGIGIFIDVSHQNTTANKSVTGEDINVSTPTGYATAMNNMTATSPSVQYAGSSTVTSLTPVVADAIMASAATATNAWPIYANIINSGGGTITNSASVEVPTPIGPSTALTSVWTNISGVEIQDQNPSASGGGANTLTNPPSAIRINSQTASGAFAIQQLGSGLNSFAGATTFSAGLTFSGLGTGTQVSCLGLTSGNIVVPLTGACNSGGGGSVSSVSNSDGTLTISPTTGAVVASLALGHANTWTAAQTFSSGIVTGVISPASDSTTAIQVKNAALSSTILDVDTTNGRLGINVTPTGTFIAAAVGGSTALSNVSINTSTATSGSNGISINADTTGGRAQFVVSNSVTLGSNLGNMPNAFGIQAFGASSGGIYLGTSSNSSPIVFYTASTNLANKRGQIGGTSGGWCIGNCTTDSGAGTLVSTGPVTISSGYTVSTLPASPGTGARAYVTDQLTTCAGVGVALTGGGSAVCPTFYNGAAWVGGFLLRRDIAPASNDDNPMFLNRAA